ncbi:hypothetical protein NXW38_00820 [Bacteroides ovatus]|nr:hypothetical protein [Bacteroides ovatus]
MLLRGFDDFSFFVVLLSRKRKAVYDRTFHKWNKPSLTADKPGRMILSIRPNTFGTKQIKTYFLADGLPGFTLPAMFFSVGDVFFTDFSFEVFLSNLPLLPFTSIFAPFSEPHQAVIFVLGAKVTPGLYGKARSSLLFSGKISSPSGSIFPKNLAFPNPYLFKHPKRKRPMRQKDALKKMSDKREADKIV